LSKNKNKKPMIIVDSRESPIIKTALVEFGSKVVEEALAPADYVVSETCAVERKEFHDFYRSIFDGRLFEQAERIVGAYETACLIVEGNITNILKNVQNPLVFWGALAKVLADHKLSVIFTPNELHTAMFLYSLAKKFQEEKRRRVAVRYKPKVYTLKQIQLLTVQSLPQVGPERAEMLLKKFGSVRRVFQATKPELLSVKGLGEKTVRKILEVLDSKYSAT